MAVKRYTTSNRIKHRGIKIAEELTTQIEPTGHPVVTDISPIDAISKNLSTRWNTFAAVEVHIGITWNPKILVIGKRPNAKYRPPRLSKSNLLPFLAQITWNIIDNTITINHTIARVGNITKIKSSISTLYHTKNPAIRGIF
jgi:hypothetical protein